MRSSSKQAETTEEEGHIPKVRGVPSFAEVEEDPGEVSEVVIDTMTSQGISSPTTIEDHRPEMTATNLIKGAVTKEEEVVIQQHRGKMAPTVVGVAMEEEADLTTPRNTNALMSKVIYRHFMWFWCSLRIAYNCDGLLC